MNGNEDKTEARVWLDAEPAIDEFGNVRLLVTKIYPQIKVSHGYSFYQGGYTAIPDGQLLVKFPLAMTGGIAKDLYSHEFADLLDKMVDVLQGSVSAFVDINITSQKEASKKFHEVQEEGDEIA